MSVAVEQSRARILIEVTADIVLHESFEQWRELHGDEPCIVWYDYINRAAGFLADALNNQTSRLYEIGEAFANTVIVGGLMTDEELQRAAADCERQL